MILPVLLSPSLIGLFAFLKVKKKGVRFADLCYGDEVDEDTDSTDSMTDVTAATSTTAAKTGSGDGKATGWLCKNSYADST